MDKNRFVSRPPEYGIVSRMNLEKLRISKDWSALGQARNVPVQYAVVSLLFCYSPLALLFSQFIFLNVYMRHTSSLPLTFYFIFVFMSILENS